MNPSGRASSLQFIDLLQQGGRGPQIVRRKNAANGILAIKKTSPVVCSNSLVTKMIVKPHAAPEAVMLASIFLQEVFGYTSRFERRAWQIQDALGDHRGRFTGRCHGSENR